MLPQNPSFAGVIGVVAVVCCCAVDPLVWSCCAIEGGALCGDAWSCASAGIPIADASKSTASWLGEGVKFVILLFMKLGYLAFLFRRPLPDQRGERVPSARPGVSNNRAKEGAWRSKILYYSFYCAYIFDPIPRNHGCPALEQPQQCTFFSAVYFLPGKVESEVGLFHRARGII
jgi:hypothetical protein